MQYLGELAAIATAVCWGVTSVSFEDAGRRIGSMNLNLLRLFFGIVFLTIFTSIVRGMVFPTDADVQTWVWLLLSGLIGIVIGDLLLFEAFVRIGARVSMLIYASVPPLSALFAYFILGESMSYLQLLGMIITIGGIALVILDGGENKVKLSHPFVGILFAFGGAVGQALGYIVGKFGMAGYDAFASTQIRLIGGIIGFVIIFTIIGQWKKFIPSLKQKKAIKSTIIGSIFGPFLGISLSLYAIQNMNSGMASTMIAITPVLLIPYSIFIKKENVRVKEIVGSIITIGGLAVMFL